ncbi:hypothetical protein C8R45DRAFT_1098052 [Mycena sanguinolenta]|nr:hypothetical protein C8R45DRAFT_1098052 [Mycena sanguinolenta]
MTVENCLACLRSRPSVAEAEFQSLEFPDLDLNDLITHLHQDRTNVPALKALTFWDCGTEFTGWRLGTLLATRAGGSHDGMVKLESFRPAFSNELRKHSSKRFGKNHVQRWRLGCGFASTPSTALDLGPPSLFVEHAGISYR